MVESNSNAPTAVAVSVKQHGESGARIVGAREREDLRCGQSLCHGIGRSERRAPGPRTETQIQQADRDGPSQSLRQLSHCPVRHCESSSPTRTKPLVDIVARPAWASDQNSESIEWPNRSCVRARRCSEIPPLSDKLWGEGPLSEVASSKAP